MTFDESLKTVSPGVAFAIERIVDLAGTIDADWAVLKAASEMVAELAEEQQP